MFFFRFRVSKDMRTRKEEQKKDEYSIHDLGRLMNSTIILLTSNFNKE
ncbi:hypothetical protein CP8484711_0416 [Chlamydia psittaci 84-8471/1]|nr:hypothetical protein CP8484711_0416 [Chlamydia psittaci 84-8471/1]